LKFIFPCLAFNLTDSVCWVGQFSEDYHPRKMGRVQLIPLTDELDGVAIEIPEERQRAGSDARLNGLRAPRDYGWVSSGCVLFS